MKRIAIEGKICVGPTFSTAEFSLMKRNLAVQRGLETLAGLLGVSGNNQRLRVLYLLSVHKEMCVCDLGEVLDLSPSAVSQHLRKLKDKNIVKSRRKGQTIYYSISGNNFTRNLISMLTKEDTSHPLSFIHDEVAS